MNNSRTGESFVGIIIGVFILGIVIVGIMNLIIFSNNLIKTYDENVITNVLKESLSNILTYVDTSNVWENEIFYIYKNNTTKQYDVFTGSSNVAYKYIDEYGEKIDDINTYDGDIYSRILWLEREDTTLWQENQIIRAGIRKLIKE